MKALKLSAGLLAALILAASPALAQQATLTGFDSGSGLRCNIGGAQTVSTCQLQTSGSGGGGGGGAATIADGADVNAGAKADSACGTDNGTCTLNALVKRGNQRLTTINTTLGTPFQAGGALGATENHAGQVTTAGFQVTGATMTRPADTTAYAAFDLFANSTTAGSVTPISLAVARVNAGTVRISYARLMLSSTSLTNAQFRIHFYTKAPTVANGDNSAWSTTMLSSGAPIYCGSMDVTLIKAFTDGAEGEAYATIGGAVQCKADAGVTTIQALVENRAAYTPTNAETLILTVAGDAD